MFLRLLHLEWKAFFRSASVGKGIAVKVLIGFFAFYFAAIFLFVGFQSRDILEEFYPGEEPLYLLNRFLLLWILSEIVMRFMLQSLPVVNIKPFLIQQMSRSTIVNYLLAKSILSVFNMLSPLFFIPFALISVQAGAFTGIQMGAWLGAILSIILLLNFLNFIIQKKFAENLKALLPFVGIALVLTALEYFGYFSSTAIFGKGFDLILMYPFLCVVPIFLLIFIYRANFKYLKRNLYLDTILRDSSKLHEETDFSWTNKFGAVAPFLQLDMKMIWRNKRPKSAITFSSIFLLYGLIFYTNPSYTDSSFLVFVGIFMTGIFLMTFGQFIPAWDSGYFSMLMSQNIPMELYLNSKAILMYISIAVLAVLSTPYIYFGWHIFLINLGCALYNLGVNVPVILYFGSLNKKKIDLDKTQFFNYQGTGAAQWIVSIPLFLVPMLIWLLVSKIFDGQTASFVLAALGIVGLLLKNVLMSYIVRAYQVRKHGMISGFKQQN